MSPKSKDCRLGRAPKEKDKSNGEKIEVEAKVKIPKPTKEKSKRADRSEKLQQRREMSLTVVKSALRAYIRYSNYFKSVIINAMQERVRNASVRYVHGSYILSTIVKFCFDGQADVCAVNGLDVFFEQTFFRQLMLGTDDAQQPDPLIQEFFEENTSFRPSTTRHLGDRNIFSAASKRYQVNLINSLRTNAESRISKFAKVFSNVHGLSDCERMFLFRGICGYPIATLPQSNKRKYFPMRPIIHRAIAEHRRVLNLNAGERVSKGWLRTTECLVPLLRYNVILNRFYEEHDKKRFNIVPICNIKSHFVTIDSYSLYGILKENEIIDCSEETFIENKEAHWNALFKISQLRGKDCEFGCAIETDGVSVCFHFQRPRRRDESPESEAPQYVPKAEDFVVGCDPGRINVYFMATVLPDGTIKTFSLTRNQYYRDAGIFNARKQSETWNSRIKRVLERMSTVSTKGCNIDAHANFLIMYLRNRSALWNEYTKPRWARQRLRLYGGKKRVFATFFNMVEKELRKVRPDCNIVVAYGSAKFAPGGRGELSVPTSRAYKECASRVTTKVTSEFRTSKIDYRNDRLLHLVAVSQDRTRQPKEKGLRGILWDGVRFISRDLNAAMNIRRQLIDRPSILNRRNATGRLVQHVRKRIRPRAP